MMSITHSELAQSHHTLQLYAANSTSSSQSLQQRTLHHTAQLLTLTNAHNC